MQRTKSELKLKWWPSPQDYNEAIQNPHVNFEDSELKSGDVYVDSLGIPRPVTGAFASVYRVQCSSGDRAVRCFLRDVADAEKRYSLISNFVQHDDLISTVTFDYLGGGIRVNGQWFPLLKMEWVEGETLDAYTESVLSSNSALEQLAEKFKIMCEDLHRAGIAHGDLQHGNIMVRRNELVLVDYDGMYVPSMQGFASTELGHRNYQHPGRSEEHFGPYLDNFSAWVIYASLRALAIDPQLYKQLKAGDDCLLFRSGDFVNPLRSSAFAALEGHSSEELRTLARFIRSQLKNSPDKIPPIGADISGTPGLEPLSPSTSPVRPSDSSASSLPEWLNASAVNAIDSNGDKAAAASARSSANSISRPLSQWQRSAVQSSQAHSGAVAKIEPELLKPTPRRVRFNYNNGMPPELLQMLTVFNPLVWILVYSIFQASGAPWWELATIIIMLCEYIIWSTPLKHKRLARTGVPVIGRVTKLKTGVAPSFDFGGIYYSFRYEYEYEKGRKHSARSQICRDEWSKLKVSQRITILYDPASPLRSVPYKSCKYKAT